MGFVPETRAMNEKKLGGIGSAAIQDSARLRIRSHKSLPAVQMKPSLYTASTKTSPSYENAGEPSLGDQLRWWLLCRHSSPCVSYPPKDALVMKCKGSTR